jgi:hypothetical protein
MKSLIKMLMVVWLVFIISNTSYACSYEDTAIQKLLGTWAITNETNDPTYAGTSGKVTFYNGYMTIDSGRFAAAGIVESTDDVCLIALKPILIKAISDSLIYVTWTAKARYDGSTWPYASMLTIVKQKNNRYTIIGEGGCGLSGTPRISYLEKIIIDDGGCGQ